jgi:hypothetical protein
MRSSAAIDFRVFSVLSESVIILGRNAGPFLALTLVVFSPLLLVSAMPETVGYTVARAVIDISTIAAVIGGLVLPWVLTAALSPGAREALQARRMGIRACVRSGLAQVLPSFGVTLLVSLAATFGIYVLTIVWVAIPAAVLEKTGIAASVRRSRALTRGYRWRIFGLLTMLFLLHFGVIGVLTLVIGVLPPPLAEAGAAADGLVTFAAFVLSMAFAAVATHVGYHRLRLVKEGAAA